MKISLAKNNSITIIMICISIFYTTIFAETETSLSLAEAIQKAMANNPSLQISTLDATISESQVSWGRAGVLPKVDFTASYLGNLSDTRQDSAIGGSKKNTQVQSTATNAGVNANWTLFEGFASLAVHDRLASQSLLSRFRREQTKQDLIAQVTLAYMDIVRQQSILSALDSAVAFSKERLKITEGKYGYGSVSKLELLQAKLDLSEDLSNQLKQNALLANSQRVLNKTLFYPDSISIKLVDSIGFISLPTSQSLRESAMEQNPILNQTREGKKLSSAAFREYKGHLFPQVGVSAGYNYGLSQLEIGPLKANQTLGLSYGINLKWNLFDGLVLPDDYHNAKATERRAAIVYEDVRSQIESALAQVQENYETSIKLLELENSNLSLAKENANIALERMRLGTIVALELRAAQEKLIKVETRLVTARFEAKRYETEWLRLAGRLGL